MSTPVDYRRRIVTTDQVVSHPAPEVTARPAAAEEIPTGAKRVMKAALAAGWEVNPTYARGHAMGSRGETKGLTHSLALRMCLPGTRYRAAAVWTAAATSEAPALKWSADSAFAWLAANLFMAREIPLTAGRKDPDALNMAAYLLDPSRLTKPCTVGSVTTNSDERSGT